MVASLVNRNQAPTIVDAGDHNLPEFDKGYDLKEQQRVIDTLSALGNDSRVEVWEELLSHTHDDRYCLTFGVDGFQSNRTVGYMCLKLAKLRFQAALEECLDQFEVDREFEVWRDLELPPGFVKDPVAWRKKQTDKPLHELQIDELERARPQIAKMKKLPEDQRQRMDAAIVKRIQLMRKTKRADFVKFRFPGDRDVAR
jgi:hypothetical protein